MNEKPPSIWKKPLKGPGKLLGWTGILFVAVFVVIFCLGSISDRNLKMGEFIPQTLVLSLIIAVAAMGLLRLARWMCHWRNFRKVLFGVFCLITLVALFWAEENWRGHRAWENFKREYEAKGEKFDLASFVPPPVPDDQNLAMTPLLRTPYDFTSGTNGVHWNDTNAYERLQHLHPGEAVHGSTNTAPGLGNVEKGKSVDLELWKTFFNSNTNYPQPSVSGSAAADVLVALGKFNAEMAELQHAAADRPFSRFPIRYQDNPPFSILLPHLAPMKGLSQLFLLRALARLELQQSDEALADLQTAFRLSDSIRDEPFLIDHLVRIGLLSMDVSCVREGLFRHSWNDNQLAAIQRYLASLDILAEYKRNLRGERSLNLAGLDYYRRKGFAANPGELFDMNDEGGTGGSSSFPSSLNVMPGGWYYRNMLAIAGFYQQFVLPSVDEQKHRVFPDVANGLTNALASERITPYNIFAKMLMPALSRASLRSGRTQSTVDEAKVACAIERYRLVNGHLPESLDALVPKFLEKIPNDVVDGKPLRYRVDSDGGYILYSVGWNQTDDGGIIPQPQGKNQIVDRTKDDWVWQMPGK
jgi:hypothetical protein